MKIKPVTTQPIKKLKPVKRDDKQKQQQQDLKKQEEKRTEKESESIHIDEII